MRIRDLLINLDEGLVAGEFKIGFELEAYYGSDITKKVNYDELKKIIKLYLPENDPKIMKDKSLSRIRLNGKEYNSFNGFEFASQPYEFTISNIQKILNFLENLSNHYIYTNENCGFHVHLSYPGITKDDAVWIISHIVLNQEKFEDLQHLEDISFWEGFYASSYELEKLRGYILSKNFKKIAELISNSKFRILRIHPQGTIEWRGPRNFLGRGEQIIKKFLLKLWNFVKQIIKIMDTQTIADISKEEYLRNLNQLYKETPIDYDLSFGDEIKIKRIIEQIKRNPKIINKLNPSLQKSILDRYPEGILFLENPSDEALMDYASDIRIFKQLDSKYRTKNLVHKIIKMNLYLIEDFYIYLTDQEINEIFIKRTRDWLENKELQDLFFKLDKPMLWNSLFLFLEDCLIYKYSLPIFTRENQLKIIKKNPYAVRYIRDPGNSLLYVSMNLLNNPKYKNIEMLGS